MYPILPRALPAALLPLTELALDLRWTWHHGVDGLWRDVDTDIWTHTHNPWLVLQNAPQAQLERLSADTAFLDRLKAAVDARRHYLDTPGMCAERWRGDLPRYVAYFSMEFGLNEALPLYAGGLGVLAGDYLKTASDLDLPMLGVGLLFQEGYFRQLIDAEGRQREAYPFNDPTHLPIQPALGSDGAWLEVVLSLLGRTLRLRVWQAQVGRSRLYLLDSNHVLNGAVDRGITSKLYASGSEMRLMQAVVLGIGGWALLDSLNCGVEVCHLNEGHAALAVLERARRHMHRTGGSFQEAWWATRAGNVFTTHTPVAAGFDAFTPALVEKYSRDLLADCGIGLHELLALGRADPNDDNERFNMAYLAIRGCAQSSAVSRLHGQVSRQLFAPLFRRWPLDEVPIRHVTNGVHVPSWDSAWADALWTQACGKGRWLGEVACLQSAVAARDDVTLWNLAGAQRRELVHYARDRACMQLQLRGQLPHQAEQALCMLDPDVLTVGLARRFTEYKRMDLLLHDTRRLVSLLTDPVRPVQLIVAGKAHPDDEIGKQQVQAWVAFTRRPELCGRALFLEDYDLALAQRLVEGVDLWINTPRRPWEACGTSGMKILVNGGLNVSTLDGWWAEAYDPLSGWAIDGHGGDAEDAASLYRILEEEVLPCFYDRDARGIPVQWVQRMRNSMSRLTPDFSSNRMLLDYAEHFYVPAARGFRRRKEQRILATWSQEVLSHWHEIRFGDIDARLDGNQWRFRVHLYLGSLDPAWVEVELYADEIGGLPVERLPMQAGAPITGTVGGLEFSALVPAIRPANDYTVRIRPKHKDAFLPAELPLIAWQR